MTRSTHSDLIRRLSAVAACILLAVPGLAAAQFWTDPQTGDTWTTDPQTCGPRVDFEGESWVSIQTWTDSQTDDVWTTDPRATGPRIDGWGCSWVEILAWVDPATGAIWTTDPEAVGPTWTGFGRTWTSISLGVGSIGPEACTNGSAGAFPCSGISLRKRVPIETLGGPGARGRDVWGWFDAQTGNEYALVGMENGTAFVDVSNPEDPIFLGRLPAPTVDSFGRDTKVYQDHAYIVTDGRSAVNHGGIQVFDLTRLRGLVAPQTFSADVVYGDFNRAHNVAINEESGFAYAVGGGHLWRRFTHRRYYNAE